MAARQALIVPAIGKHTATWRWLDLLAENWRRRGKFEEVKFIFPNAPDIPITINFGARMPGWYDIVRRRDDTTFSDLDQAHDESGILHSRAVFNKLITDEVTAGIPSTRIVLGGFSQGGAMSLFTGITTPHKLAGVFGLSAYLVMANKIKTFAEEANGANKDTPFFMAHGDADEVVKYKWGEQSAETLKKELGHKVQFNTYRNLAHNADLLEIDDLEDFLKKCLLRVK